MRVKTWQRLQPIGAISTRNSVYVLPNTEACREDFRWVRSKHRVPARQDAVKALAALDRLIAEPARETVAAIEPPLEPSAFHHRR